MPVVVKHKCGTLLELRLDMAGKRGVCPACGGAIVIPEHDELRALLQKARANHLHKEMAAEGVALEPAEPAPAPAASVPPEDDFAKGLEEFADIDISDIEFAPEPEPAPLEPVSPEPAPPKPPAPKAQPEPEAPAAQEKAAEPEEVKPCPFCGKDMPADGVICVNCGTNIKTGQKLGTVTHNESAGNKSAETEKKGEEEKKAE